MDEQTRKDMLEQLVTFENREVLTLDNENSTFPVIASEGENVYLAWQYQWP